MPRKKPIAYRLAPKFATIILKSTGWTMRSKATSKPAARNAVPSTDADTTPGWSYGAGSRRSLGHHSTSQLSIDERDDYVSDCHTVPPETDDDDRLSRYPSVVSGSATAHSSTASFSEVENDELVGSDRQRHAKDNGDDYFDEEEDDEPRLVVLGGDEGYKADVEYSGSPPRKKRVTGKKTSRPVELVAQVQVQPVMALLPADVVPKRRLRYGGRPHLISGKAKGVVDVLPKDTHGYVMPIEAYRRLLQGPTLWVQTFDEVFLPSSDKAVVETVDRRVENITCCIRRSVSTTGEAVWGQIRAPCGTVVRTWESYRRHFISSHLGCKRPTGGLKLRHSIQARLLAADPPPRKSLKRKRVASDEDVEADSERESRSEGEEEEA